MLNNTFSSNINSQNDQPEVVILVLNWNGWRNTIECVESLFRLRYKNFRIVIIDNASTDDSISRLSEWLDVPDTKRLICTLNQERTEHVFLEPTDVEVQIWKTCKRGEKSILTRLHDSSLIVLRNELNHGYAEGNNIGIRFSMEVFNPPFILLLNNDTTVEQDSLMKLIHSAMIHSDAALFGPIVYWYDDPNRIQYSSGTMSMWTGRRRPLMLNPSVLSSGIDIEVDYLGGVAILIRTSILKNVGLLDSDYFMYTEDVDFSYRVRKNGSRIIQVPSSKITHKGSQSSGGPNSTFVTYYTFRNPILFMKKNARWYNWPTFLISSSIIVALRIFQTVVTDPKRSKSMIIGLMDGFFHK